MELKKIRISARISDLARLQAFQVGEALKKKFPKLEVVYNFRKSLGDINLQDPLWKMPEKGAFTQDFLKDLTEGTTDIVVHSWKDLPTEKSPHTEIIATLPRADQRDLLLLKTSSVGVDNLKIFSSSPRRAYNLSACLPDLMPWKFKTLEFLSVRGNVQTRVRKWKEDTSIHGLVVAKAAMDRLLTDPNPEFDETQKFLKSALVDEKWMVLPLSVNPTAAAQGALAIEILSSRDDLKTIFSEINDAETFYNVEAERKILRGHGGGCHQKIGISVMNKDFGTVESLRGLTDQGITLLTWGTHQAKNFPKLNVGDLGILKNSEVKRSEVNTSQPSSAESAYFVARADAWPTSWQALQNIIWTAGIQTWKRMASIGVWVNGTSDSLGEDIPYVQHLQPQLEGKTIQWFKLTHSSSSAPTSMKKIVTYQVDIKNEDALELAQKKMVFWKSSSQYSLVEALAAANNVKSKTEFHACGPGSTYEFLKTKVPHDKLFVFLTEDEWREKCQL